jgi:5'-3' exonuclease
MDEFSDNEAFATGSTLNIDGDILIYKPCCVHNEDTDICREAIVKGIKDYLKFLLMRSGCDSYKVFLTPKTNFRNYITDDYKANRKGVVRPVNLVWAKEWATTHLNAVVIAGLEADDLLSIYQTDDTVLWSPDKDLRQVPGMHLDDNSKLVTHVDEVGVLKTIAKGKIYFSGTVGLYYQMLVGDSADYIVGCGSRVSKVYKSGKKRGQGYISRQGVGPKEAMDILTRAVLRNQEDPLGECRQAVFNNYDRLFGKKAKEKMEAQANLLFMVQKLDLDTNRIQRWTLDDRVEYMCLHTGEITVEESDNRETDTAVSEAPSD